MSLIQLGKMLLVVVFCFLIMAPRSEEKSTRQQVRLADHFTEKQMCIRNKSVSGWLSVLFF